jgi:uncharacterized protein YvpB
MRRLLAIVAALVLAATSLGAHSPVARAAGAVNTWITIATTSPGVGCVVHVGVEARSGGNPVPGLTVGIALFDSANNLISSDVQETRDDGVAILSFDTSGATAGESDWLDIDIDGSYLKGTAIVPTADGACEGDAKEITASAEISIPLGGGDVNGAPSFPTTYQRHTLSCEYASLQIATAALGNEIDEDTFIPLVASAKNPHNGYRGDIDGAFGSTDDYGVYAEPLVDALAQVGFVGTVWYDPEQWAIQAQLDAGHPTLVWISTHGDTGFYDEDSKGNSFKLVPWEHVVVAYAYDETGIFVSDPGNGSLEHFTWEWFLDAWGIMDGMSLSVSTK